MITAQDLRGVNAMVPAFATPDAGSLDATSTIDVDNLAEGVDRIIKDGVPIVTTTGSFGECYNLFWDEFKLLASTTVEVVNKRVPVFIGATSPNPREAVQRMKFIQDIGADGTLLGLPYYDTVSAEYVGEFYTQMAQHFPELA
ncbi:MAG: dihydrodipicolinate synthase family protein, partial [Gemmatimonadetes bacterium]|nr:dihydrodipicolinate synthase family protein [Gemmatimonadota bacterium]